MSHSLQSLISLDENQGLYFIETTPMSIPPSPEHEKKPVDSLVDSFRTNGRYFEDPNPLIKCYNCNEYGHMSGTCPNPCYKFRCNYCGEPGHTAYNCTQIVCHKCFGIGHKINNCSADIRDKCSDCRRLGHNYKHCIARQDPLASKNTISITCLVCREIGHANCYQIESYSRSLYCSKCGEKGHLRIECSRR
jgi:Zinc knuckle